MKSVESLFVPPDENIAGDSFRDPMGLQVIWSPLGQKIVGRTITSITPDIRNFTLNLFHHWALRRMETEESGLKPGRLAGRENWTIQHPDFRAACLVLFENLAACSAVNPPEGKEFDSQGILGSSIAARRHREGELDERPFLLGSKDGKGRADADGLLVRQRVYGVSGRYKTPFIQMALLERNPRDKKPDPWLAADESLRKWKEAGRLAGALIKVVRVLLDGKKIDWKWAKEEAEISELYLELIGTIANIPESMAEFWYQAFGFRQGATDRIAKTAKKMQDWREGVWHEDGWRTLVHASLEAGEAQGPRGNEVGKEVDGILKGILELEPILVNALACYQLCCCRSVRTIVDFVNAYREISGENSWSSIVKGLGLLHPGTMAERLGLKDFPRASERVGLLAQVWNDCAQDPASVPKTLSVYHQKVMEARGGNPLFGLSDARINQYAVTYSKESIRSLLKLGWYNDYYLGPFTNLLIGLDRVGKVVVAH